jgi:flagellar biosynthesis protein FlhA
VASSKTLPAPIALPDLAGLSRINLREIAVPLAVLAIIVTLVTPLPAFMLDILIVTDIMLSVVVLMVAMYIIRPADFSVFPTMLLLLTLFRLALNVSSTRLILMNGNSGTAAAGEVIQAFGSFVVGGNYVIGAVIFLVLIAIQYVVINHGAVRISEVTARFTLDALPGKQMSIDSDLNAGLIDDVEAKRRRRQLAAEAEFYGAMDGASRFTQRDAVASILITAINIIAGLLIGVFQHAMPLQKAVETYTVLTIGDGLVTVIPALLISVSGGLVITRAASDVHLGVEVERQLFSKSQPLFLASGVLVALAGFPGLPKIPFLLMGAGIGVLAWNLKKRARRAEETAKDPKAVPASHSLESMLRVEPISLELGLGLVRMVEGGADSSLMRRIAAIRRQLVADLGYLLPAIKVSDSVSLRHTEYSVSIKGVEIARYELPPGQELAIPAGKPTTPPQGKQTTEPAFGMKAWWVPASASESVRRSGFTVVDGLSVLGTHLSELARRYGHEILSRQDVKKILDRVGLEQPKLVEDLVPKLLSLGTVQRVLQNLLRERVSIRDTVSILEALGEAAPTTRNPVLLTEYVRQSIRRSVVKPFLNRTGDLPAYILDPSIEREVESAVEHGEQTSHLALAPQAIRDIYNRINQHVGIPEAPVPVLASSGCRYFLRQIVDPSIRNLFFLSHNEVPSEFRIVSLGVIR